MLCGIERQIKWLNASVAGRGNLQSVVQGGQLCFTPGCDYIRSSHGMVLSSVGQPETMKSGGP